jgi:hypothetical protein
LALRVGLIGPALETFGLLLRLLECPFGGVLADAIETECGWGRLWGFLFHERGLDNHRWAINNQLRTGADKGTPTV